jgi:competence protein ComEC
MNAPLAWLALGAVVGAFSWLWLPLSVAQLGVMAMAGVLTISTLRSTLHILGLVVLGLSLGQASITTQPAPQPVHGIAVGRVAYTSGRSAMLETQQGKLWAQFPVSAPSKGAVLSAQIRPAADTPVLPGGWLTDARVKLARATKVKVGHWTQRTSPEQAQDLPEGLRHGAVLTALATGDRSNLSPSTTERLRRTGTVHLLAISGLHVGIVAGLGSLIGWLLSRPFCSAGLPRVARWGPGLGGVLTALCYGQMVHWPVSTQRAAWMVVFVALCALCSRKVHPWQALGLAALAVLLCHPAQVASLGFLLSFSAVAALIGWMPAATEWLRPSHPRALRWCVRSLAATVIATFGTLPIAALVFQSLAPAAPLANLVAVPLFAGLAVPAALMGIHGPAVSAEFCLFIADTAVDIAMVWLSWMDLGTITIAVGHLGAILLFIAVFSSSRPKVAALCIALAFCPIRPHRSGMEVTFPAVGQGSCTLIRWPDGRLWLVDGGPPGRRLLHWLRREGVETLDAVFLTHPDLDHLGGLMPVIDALDVRSFWVSRKPTSDEQHFRALWLRAHQQGITAAVFGPGEGTPATDNDTGLVLTLRHGSHRFLLLGDVGAETETRLAEHMPSMTVVLVSHHGSKNSSSAALISAASAQHAVVQAGAMNRYGHPHDSVIQAWGSDILLRTDQLGSIRMESDGMGLDIRRWHPQTLWASVMSHAKGSVDTTADQS